MAENRQYDHEYKVQAVKLAKEIGQAKAAKELGVPKTPCMAGYGLTVLAILTLELAHRLHKTL